MAEILKRPGSVSILTDLLFDRYGLSVSLTWPCWKDKGRYTYFYSSKTRYEYGYVYSISALPVKLCFCVLED